MLEDYKIVLTHDECVSFNIGKNLIGMPVVKKNGTLFENGLLCNICNGIVRNDNTGLWELTFEDNISSVAVESCISIIRNKLPEMNNKETRFSDVVSISEIDKINRMYKVFSNKNSYNNFIEMLNLVKKWHQAKMNGKKHEKLDYNMIVDYHYSDPLILVSNKNGFGYTVLTGKSNNMKTSVIKKHLSWFDFLKDLHVNKI